MSEMWLLNLTVSCLLCTSCLQQSSRLSRICKSKLDIHHHCNTMANYSRPFTNLRLRGISAIILLAAWQLHIDAVGSAQKSVCQNLAPSPQLKKFVDKLPIMRTIPVSPKRISIGAWKIQQVTISALIVSFNRGN